MRHLLHIVICALTSHKWHFLRFGPRHKPEFSPMAHADADCERCGKQHRDCER